jgi:hypothetical protein
MLLELNEYQGLKCQALWRVTDNLRVAGSQL